MGAIEIQELAVDRLKQPVLHGLTATISAGKVTGLIGPSGCGKTTLMRTIVGTQRLRRGSITIDGLPAGHPQLRARVAYVTQAHAIYLDLTVRENLQYFASVYGASQSRISQTLEIVGLHEMPNRMAAKLSGGQQSRVSLATALLADPDVLVLDEPTVGLDPMLRRDLWQVFHALAAASKTVLISSHVMDEAERCDELLLMHEGRLVAQGSPGELRARAEADSLEGAFLQMISGGGR